MKEQGATAAQVGDLLDISPRRVQQLAKEGVFPKLGRGRYPLVGCVRAYVKFWQDIAEGNSDGGLDEVRKRKLTAEAESKELDVSVKRGDLVPLDEVESMVRESLEAVDSVLRHAPSRFAPSLAKEAKIGVKESRAIMREVIESVRGAIRESGDADA